MKSIMKKFILMLTGFLGFTLWNGSVKAQDSITDFDGNVYHTVTIGTQVWLQENLRSLHYSDMTSIPGAVFYENSDSLAGIYGMLYDWYAAMKNSTTPGSQGVCPDGWHVPDHYEWIKMDNFLGGYQVAGGKLKEAGTVHWLSPNTGATNSSGFTGLPAGEFDGNQSQNFQFLGMAAVFWTSTQAGSLMATERYLSHDDAMSKSLDWYKTMKYSIRCIRDNGVGLENAPDQEDDALRISSPFGNNLVIMGKNVEFSRILIYSLSGQLLIEKNLTGSFSPATVDTGLLPSGFYLVRIWWEDISNRVKLDEGLPVVSVFKCIKL